MWFHRLSQPKASSWAPALRRQSSMKTHVEKGRLGSALMGSLQFLCFLQGLFGYFRLSSPKCRARAYLVPQSVKFIPVQRPHYCWPHLSAPNIGFTPSDVEAIKPGSTTRLMQWIPQSRIYEFPRRGSNPKKRLQENKAVMRIKHSNTHGITLFSLSLFLGLEPLLNNYWIVAASPWPPRGDGTARPRAPTSSRCSRYS